VDKADDILLQLQVLLELLGSCKSWEQKEAIRGEARKAIRKAERLIRAVQNKVNEVRIEMGSFNPDVEPSNNPTGPHERAKRK
jgi:hypothetical protein